MSQVELSFQITFIFSIFKFHLFCFFKLFELLITNAIYQKSAMLMLFLNQLKILYKKYGSVKLLRDPYYLQLN